MIVYVSARRREGVRPFEITDKDRKDFQKVKEYTPGRIAAQLLFSFGFLFVMATFYPSDDPMSLGTRFGCLIFGVGLIALAVWIAKPRQRPRWWWTVTWGMSSSASYILLFVSLIIIKQTPVSHGHPLPNWLLSMTTLAIVIGIPSAILCLIYGVGMLIGMKSEKRNENPVASELRIG